MGADLRLITGWTGLVLFYGAAFLSILVGPGFIALAAWGAARGDVRLAKRYPAVGRLLIWIGAAGVCGMGLTVVSLDYPPFIPLGVAIIAAGVAIAAYGPRLLRRLYGPRLDAQDERTPWVRRRGSPVALLRWVGIAMIALAGVAAAIGIGALVSPSADRSPRILVIAGILLVFGAGSYLTSRSYGPPIANDQWTQQLFAGWVRRAIAREVIFIVQLALLVILFVVLWLTSR